MCEPKVSFSQTLFFKNQGYKKTDLNVQGLMEYCTHVLFLRTFLEDKLHLTKREWEKLCKWNDDEHSIYLF